MIVRNIGEFPLVDMHVAILGAGLLDHPTLPLVPFSHQKEIENNC